MAFAETVKKLIKEAYGDEVKIVDIQKQQGTKAGENFGSVMFALTVTIESKKHNQSKLNLMSKSLPTSKFIRDAFNVQVTFPKEVEFYQIVLPEYAKLLEENNINIDYKKSFPHFIGAEFERNGEVIQEATLLMENIKVEGYTTRPKSEGLDLEHSKMVMREIALLHALGVALKVQKPQIYETKIKNVGRSIKEGQDVETCKVEIYTFMEQVLDYLKQIPEVEDLVPRLKKVTYDNFLYSDMIEGYKPREPFSTLIHNDLWLNNIMFKYDDKPISVKLVDFQRTKIGSPVSDLMLFLYVSTSLDVMKNNFDDLLKLYHDHFLESLTRLGVSADGLSWHNFQEELKYASEDVSFPVAMLRLLFIQVECDASEFDMDSFSEIGGVEKEKSRIRHVEVVKDLARRAWI